jgi:uncharacterized protein with PIN domain
MPSEGMKCPKCGGEMRRVDYSQILEPIESYWYCDSCGYPISHEEKATP